MRYTCRPKVKKLKSAVPSLENTTRGFRLTGGILLIYRGVRAGRTVVLVPPAYTCSECGARAKLRLGLGVRVFDCAACAYTADRDVNAARTILATAERVRASADDVRHAIASFRDGGSDAVRAGNPPDLSVGKH